MGKRKKRAKAPKKTCCEKPLRDMCKRCPRRIAVQGVKGS